MDYCKSRISRLGLNGGINNDIYDLGEEMMTTLKDVVFGTPAGNKAVEEALKKSCEDQVKLLKKESEVKNERIKV